LEEEWQEEMCAINWLLKIDAVCGATNTPLVHAKIRSADRSAMQNCYNCSYKLLENDHNLWTSYAITIVRSLNYRTSLPYIFGAATNCYISFHTCYLIVNSHNSIMHCLFWPINTRLPDINTQLLHSANL